VRPSIYTTSTSPIIAREDLDYIYPVHRSRVPESQISAGSRGRWRLDSDAADATIRSCTDHRVRANQDPLEPQPRVHRGARPCDRSPRSGSIRRPTESVEHGRRARHHRAGRFTDASIGELHVTLTRSTASAPPHGDEQRGIWPPQARDRDPDAAQIQRAADRPAENREAAEISAVSVGKPVGFAL
jgi:hypothetical protein